MPCCSRTGASEPEAPILDVSLLEANEYSVKVGFSMPNLRASTASSSSSWWPWANIEDETEFKVAVFGGPNSDIYGPKEELVQCRRGRRVVHEVRGLAPDTEYTVEVSLLLSTDRRVRGTTEVRTARASTAQFAEEDWGRSALGKYGKGDEKKDKVGLNALRTPGATSSSSSSSSSGPLASEMAPGPSLSLQRSTPPRTLSGDDCSTIAPSDAGADFDAPEAEISGPVHDRQDDVWDSTFDENATTEAVSPQQSPHQEVTREAEMQIEFEELTTSGRSIQCNLCSMMDCLKLGRTSEKSKADRKDPTEIILDAGQTAQPVAPAEVAAQPPPPSSQRKPGAGRRPYRPAFPGTPVDPASVGLELLPALNESQLQAVIDDRLRNASRARGV